MQIESELIFQTNTLPYGRIYRLTNKINNKMYHGQTMECDINDRWIRYKNLNCKSQPKIYNALKKYGPENFLFEVIDISAQDQSQLNFLETFYIRKYDSMNNGYNCNEGGDGKGIISEEVRRKLSEANKGHIVSQETRLKIRNSLKGRKLSDETIKKLSGKNNPNFGKPLSEETKRKISEAQRGELSHSFGKHISEEHKRIISENNKGHKNPNFGKFGVLHHNFGKPISEKHKQIISKSNSGNRNGMFGKKRSEESKRKQSESQLGVLNPNFGKHHSEETRRKQSEARKLYYQRKRELLTPSSKSPTL